jgi:polyisoprenoid-binding protein YceI
MATRGGAIVSTRVVVDMRTVETNDSKRDETLRSDREPLWDKHPYGRFTLGDRPLDLHGVSGRRVVADGVLRLHDVDRRVRFPLQVEFSTKRLQAAGRLRTKMTSFGFDPPSVKWFTNVRDDVTIEVKLTFVRHW